MRRKKHTAEEIVAKLRQVDVLVSQSRKVAEAIRSIEVTEVTNYRCCSKYIGMKGDQIKRLNSLEMENLRRYRAISDLIPIGDDHNLYAHERPMSAGRGT